jgi:hypothetical protein
MPCNSATASCRADLGVLLSWGPICFQSVGVLLESVGGDGTRASFDLISSGDCNRSLSWALVSSV